MNSCEPSHVAPIDVFGADAAVGFPRVVFHQMAGQHLVPDPLQQHTILRAASMPDLSPATVKPKYIFIYVQGTQAGSVTFKMLASNSQMRVWSSCSRAERKTCPN